MADIDARYQRRGLACSFSFIHSTADSCIVILSRFLRKTKRSLDRQLTQRSLISTKIFVSVRMMGSLSYNSDSKLLSSLVC